VCCDYEQATSMVLNTWYVNRASSPDPTFTETAVEISARRRYRPVPKFCLRWSASLTWNGVFSLRLGANLSILAWSRHSAQSSASVRGSNPAYAVVSLF
jgi:hypothetical protein